MCALTKDELEKLGLAMGEAIEFKLKAEALLQPPTSAFPSTAGGAAAPAYPALAPPVSSVTHPHSAASAAGGAAAAVHAPATPVTVASYPPPSSPPSSSSQDYKSKAVAVAPHHLPSVLLSSLPPLTQPCGEPGASGSVFKIEYQGKPAAVKKFHEHMRGMLSRELKTLQLLAHPNIVRVMAVMADAASQPVGFIME